MSLYDIFPHNTHSRAFSPAGMKFDRMCVSVLVLVDGVVHPPVFLNRLRPSNLAIKGTPLICKLLFIAYHFNLRVLGQILFGLD